MNTKNKHNVEKICAFIKAAKLEPFEIEQIQAAIRSKSPEIQVGDTIELRRIKPRYLVGKQVKVKKINEKSYGVDFPNDPQFRTWAGLKNLRIPRGSARKVI